LGSDEARLLLDNGACALYKRIQRKMVKLVRDYDVQLPLNCLQFFYYINEYTQTPDGYSSVGKCLSKI